MKKYNYRFIQKLIRSKVSFFICVTFISIPFFSLSKTFFVSNSGSNFNSGSQQSPFRTIECALNKLSSGDTCYILKGKYSEKIEINTHFHKNVLISGYAKDKVVICPPKRRLNWNYFKNGIYRAKMVWKVDELFLNEQPLRIATFPSINFYSFDRKKWAKIKVDRSKKISIDGNSNFDVSGSNIFAQCGRGLVTFSGKIKKAKKKLLISENNSFYWNEELESIYLGKGVGVFYGKLDFLDTIGEWYQSEKYIYYYPTTKNELKNIRFRTKNSLCQIEGSNIEIRNIKFIGYKLKVKHGSYIKFNNCSINYMTSLFKCISGYDHQKDFKEQNDESYNGQGVELGGNNNSIVHSDIKYSIGDGISLSGNNNSIHHNKILNCDYLGIDAFGINLSGNYQSVTYNLIKNTGRSCVLLANLKKCLVSKNEICNGGILCDDLGLIYTYGQSGNQTVISYNWLHSNSAKHFGAGIYLDNNHSDFVVKNNVVWDCYVAMCINQKAKNDSILNNTFFNNKYSMASFIPDGLPPIMENVYTSGNITDTDLKSRDCNVFYGTQLSNNLYDKSLTRKFNNIFLKDFSIKPSLHSPLSQIGAVNQTKWSLYSVRTKNQILGTEVNRDIFIIVCIWGILFLYFFKKIMCKKMAQPEQRIFFLIFIVKIIIGILLLIAYQSGQINSSYSYLFYLFDDARSVYQFSEFDTNFSSINFLMKNKVEIISFFKDAGIRLPMSYTLSDVLFLKIQYLLNVLFFGNQILLIIFLNFIFTFLLSKLFTVTNSILKNSKLAFLLLLPSVLIFTSFSFNEYYLITIVLLFHYYRCKLFDYKNIKYLIFSGFLYVLLIQLIPIIAILFLIEMIYHYVLVQQRNKLKVRLVCFLFLGLGCLAIRQFHLIEKLQRIQMDKFHVAKELHSPNYFNLTELNWTFKSVLEFLMISMNKFWFLMNLNNQDSLLYFHILENSFLLCFIIYLIFNKKHIDFYKIGFLFISFFFISGTISSDLVEILYYKTIIIIGLICIQIFRSKTEISKKLN